MSSNKTITIFCLSLIILLSGCININVDQKLKRNGHYDIALTISTSPEYKVILTSLKDGFKVEDSVKDKFKYMETETSIGYSFKDIDPTVDKKLFKDVETNQTQNSLYGEQDTPDSSIVNPKNIKITKEFKFPYYVYTYTLNISQKPKNNTGTEILTQDNYIFDEAKLLDTQTKNQIMQSINNIYHNDTIETIIVTKNQMDSMSYYNFQYDFIDNFTFKNINKQYILIIASTNANGVCEIDSNLYLDSKVYSKISNLKLDFEKNCTNGYKTKILDVVTKLDGYFNSTDLDSSNKLQNQMTELFKMGYTVEVFGEIIDTNGLKMDDNKVKFDINPTIDGEYTVVFQDFFITSILGDYYWIYLSSAGLIVIVGIGYLIISKHKKNLQQLQVPVGVNPQMLDYVRLAATNGQTDKQIKESLLSNGWNAKDIDVALKIK